MAHIRVAYLRLVPSLNFKVIYGLDGDTGKKMEIIIYH